MTPVARWLSRGGGALLLAALAGPVQAQQEAPGDSPEDEPGVGAEAAEEEPSPPAAGDAEPGEEPVEPVAPGAEGGVGPGAAAEPGAGAASEAHPSPGAETAAAGAGAQGASGATKASAGQEASAEAGAAPAADEHVGRFAFGTYGRVIAATDGSGRPGRDTDIVAHGSRLDLDNYVELELRREDSWPAVDANTRMVATLAFGNPIFHYNGDFDARIAVRNLYLEEKGLGLGGLGVWMGSRMLRGDDIYLLDFWPLDNLNTVGGGVRYDVCGESPPASAASEPDAPHGPDEGAPVQAAPPPPPWCTGVQLHVGLAQPDNPFYEQVVSRPAPLNQFGAATVAVLDRQRWVVSLKAEQLLRFGGPEGIKLAAYGEAHSVPSAQRETAVEGVYEPVPSDGGFVVGGQLGGFLGDRGTFLNLFVRYAYGLAAYGEFAMPSGLSVERTAAGAHEVLVATSGNWEFGPVAVTLGGYLRSFRNANEQLDFEDVDEGIVILRPQLFFLDWAGLGVEGSYQLQHRGVLIGDLSTDSSSADSLDPFTASVYRIGVIPFLAPGGPGAFSRPWFYFTYVASFRDEGAQLLYPEGDVFRIREIEHYVGFGAEWWFGSTSYGGN